MRGKLGKSCSLWWCNDKHYARGFCHRHYSNLLKHGTPIPPIQRDLYNALNAVIVLRLALKDCNPVDIHPSVRKMMERISESDNVNVTGKCHECKMDIVASLNWPIVNLACGCNCSSRDIDIIQLEEYAP